MIPSVVKDAAGKWHQNKVLFFTRPHWLCTHPESVPFRAAVVGAPSENAPMEVSFEAPFLGEKFLAQRNTAVLMTLFDETQKRWIARAPIHIDSITGDAQQPFLLTDPIWIPERGILTARFSKLAAGGAADVVRFYVEGTRYYLKDANIERLNKVIEYKRKEWLNNYLTFLTTDDFPVALPAAPATVTAFLTIPKDYHFTIKKITAVSAVGGVPTFTLRMWSHRGEEMGNEPLDSRATLGLGRLPEVLRQPWTIPANSRIRLEFTAVAAVGVPIVIYMTFTGAAHYV